jgi:hypothetical protein
LVAVSLTLNGVWLAEILSTTSLSSAQPPSTASSALISDTSWEDVASSVAETTVAVPQFSMSHTPSARSRAESVSEKKHGPKTGAASSSARVPAKSVLHPKRRAPSIVPVRSGKGAAPATRSLRWVGVDGATYYNVVLWRAGKRILDLWPRSPHVVMPTVSVTSGSQARLSPGRYLWFVYPGFGATPTRHYGPLAASGVLVVQPLGDHEG